LRITIAKIAELAGVSKATVSRVLNNSGYVAENTREKVMKIVREFNFVPDFEQQRVCCRKYPGESHENR